MGLNPPSLKTDNRRDTKRHKGTTNKFLPEAVQKNTKIKNTATKNMNTSKNECIESVNERVPHFCNYNNL